MSSTDQEGSCRTISWVAAIVLGVVGFLLARNWLEWGMVLSVIAGIVLFFVIGYLLVRVLCDGQTNAVMSKTPALEPSPPLQPVEKVAPLPTTEAKPAAPTGGKPAMLSAPRGGKADDLKKIKGVGPGLEKQLNDMGVYHFDQMSAWSASDVAWVDDNLVRFKGRATRDGWVEQAKNLASGND